MCEIQWARPSVAPYVLSLEPMAELALSEHLQLRLKGCLFTSSLHRPAHLCFHLASHTDGDLCVRMCTVAQTPDRHPSGIFFFFPHVGGASYSQLSFLPPLKLNSRFHRWLAVDIQYNKGSTGATGGYVAFAAGLHVPQMQLVHGKIYQNKRM